MLLLLFISATVAVAQPTGSSGTRRNDTLRPLTIDPRHLLREAVRQDSLAWLDYMDSLNNTRAAIMQRNMAMTMRDWMPSERDRMNRSRDIARAQDRGFLYRDIPRVQLFSIAPTAIGMALGIDEDVTPKINYTVTATMPVTVKVYGLDAVLVATMVEGVQSPGVYKLVWDFKDVNGIRVPYGNYVAEVMAGNRLLLRKRIEVP